MKVLRNLSLLTVTVMLLGILAACGGGQPAGQAPAATTAAEPTAAAEPAQPAEAAPPAEARSFTVASDASFPPMEFVDENKALTGFDIDLINAIAADQGFTVEIQNTAWDGIFAGLEAGQYDAIISSVTVTEERKAAMDFSDPYFNANQAIVVLAEDTAIAGEADLQGKTVGVQIETTGAIAVRELGIEPKQYDSPDLALQDMVNGNIDAVVVDTPVAANYALQAPQFEGKLKIVGELQTNETYALAVRKGDPEGVLPLFNAGLANIRASGEYDAIYEKWIGERPAGAAAEPAAEGNQAIVTDTSYAAANCDMAGSSSPSRRWTN